MTIPDCTTKRNNASRVAEDHEGRGRRPSGETGPGHGSSHRRRRQRYPLTPPTPTPTPRGSENGGRDDRQRLLLRAGPFPFPHPVPLLAAMAGRIALMAFLVSASCGASEAAAVERLPATPSLTYASLGATGVVLTWRIDEPDRTTTTTTTGCFSVFYQTGSGTLDSRQSCGEKPTYELLGLGKFRPRGEESGSGRGCGHSRATTHVKHVFISRAKYKL